MKTVARMELMPGMTLGEDIVWQDQVLFSAGTVLTQSHIDRMKRHSIMIATVMEDVDFATTHFEKLRYSDNFKSFEQKHAQSLMAFKKLMNDFTTNGIAVPSQELINLYNQMRITYSGGTELLDFLYNLMPNEDELTFNHCLNSALLVGTFAEWVDMPQSDKLDLILSGFFYDIGKIKLPYELLWNSGKLTPEEINLIRQHPAIGWNMLRNTGISNNILSAVLMHHERIDGSGYPRQIKGDQISIFARYIAIVDTYIAMASPRPHRNALTPLQILGNFERDIYKFDVELLVPLMRRIADAQIGSSVKLSDESSWEVIIIHPDRLSRPILKNEAQEILDLAEHPELEITKMI